jgi:rhodanese-related sulfurtransferase
MKRNTILLMGFSLITVLFYSFMSRERTNSVGQLVQYSCTPCGAECDKALFEKGGICTQCNMALVDKSTISHKNIQPAAMCTLDTRKVIFLDVRTPAEFNGTAEAKFGAIKNAINIPVQELENRMNELEKYKDIEIVVYCSHSRRSPRASYMLTQKGFKHVTNMEGGMSVWKELVKQNDCNEKLYKSQ